VFVENPLNQSKGGTFPLGKYQLLMGMGAQQTYRINIHIEEFSSYYHLHLVLSRENRMCRQAAGTLRTIFKRPCHEIFELGVFSSINSPWASDTVQRGSF
jgi:hypothetical protein